jgi:hypothetical protein
MNTASERTGCHAVRDVLLTARDLIADPSRHCVGLNACDASGHKTKTRSPSAVKWCAYGALMRFAGGVLLIAAETALRISTEALYGHHEVECINDGLDGHTRILAAYTRAIEVMTDERESGT